MSHQVKKPHGKAKLTGLSLRARQVQGYYECGPRLLSLENRGIIECLLVVFTQQLENLATTLSCCTFDNKKQPLLWYNLYSSNFESYGVIKSSSFDHCDEDSHLFFPLKMRCSVIIWQTIQEINIPTRQFCFRLLFFWP